MTGFGKYTLRENGFRIDVEVKTVNHRFLDVAIRAPRELDVFESDVRKILKRYFGRGHIELRLDLTDEMPASVEPVVDRALLSACLEAARTIERDAGVPFDVSVSSLLRVPELVTYNVLDERLHQAAGPLLRAVEQACLAARKARRTEGAMLWQDIEQRIQLLESLAATITQREPEVVEEYRARLASRVQELMPEGLSVDPARIAQEIALFADRLNVSEEVTRIRTHLRRLQELSSLDEPQGRGMDFLVQELNREFNTVASKSQDAVLTQAVLDGKAEVEKIREQIQNIE